MISKNAKDIIIDQKNMKNILSTDSTFSICSNKLSQIYHKKIITDWNNKEFFNHKRKLLLEKLWDLLTNLDLFISPSHRNNWKYDIGQALVAESHCLGVRLVLVVE